MNRTLAPFCLAACASFAMIGCLAPEDEVLDEDDRQVTAALVIDDPPTGSNHFGSKPHWAPDTQAAYRIMGAGALDQGAGYLPVLEILPDYRDEVLRNAIECGLNQNQWVIDPVTGVAYVGHWGLATSWMKAALTISERRYVTACMAQRLNAYELPLGILLEGRNKAINTVPLLDGQFPFDESTVWGDLFSSVDPVDDPEVPPYQLYACSNDDLLGICSTFSETPEDWLRYRICDSSPVCGLTVLGPCSAACTVGGAGYLVCDSVIETVHVQLAGGTCDSTP